MNNIFPSQTISTAEKLRVNKDSRYADLGAADVPAFIIAMREFFVRELQYSGSRRMEQLELARVASGHFDPEQYKRIINPYKTDNDEYKHYPAALRNFDIIRPIVDRLLGENSVRNDDMTVLAMDEESVNAYKEMLHAQYLKAYQAEILRQVQAQGIDVGSEQGQALVDEKVREAALMNWNETYSLKGQQAYNILKQELNLDDKFQRHCFNWLTVGECASYKSINHDDVYYEVVDPTELTVIGWDDTDPSGENAGAIIRETRWSSSTIIDLFRENLTEEDIDWLKKYEIEHADELHPAGFNYRVKGNNWYSDGRTNYHELEQGLIPVQHVTWKTLTKRGVLTFVDEFGQTQQMLVDEDYKINKNKGDIDIDWQWENEVWEIWTVSDGALERHSADNKVIYLKWGPIEVQRTELNNTSKCKLPYNIMRRGYKYDEIVSVVKTGLPYQELYNIFRYRFEHALGKSMDKLMVIPMGLIPNTKGWNTDKFFYFMRAFSTMVINEQSERAAVAIQALKEIDMSFGKAMAEVWQFGQQVKEEFWDAVGYNRQRYGQNFASDGKAVTQQAVIASNTSTKDLFGQLRYFYEREAEGLIDMSRYAWINGKKGVYKLRGGDPEFFDINGREHGVRSYGVYATNDLDVQEKLDFMRTQLLQPMAQNNMPAEFLAEVLDADSFSRVKQLLKKGDEIVRNFQREMAEREAQTEQARSLSEERIQEAKDILKRYEIDMKYRQEIEKALIMSDSFNAKEGDTDADGIPESEEIAQRAHARMMDTLKFAEEQRKNRVTERQAQQKLEIEAKKAAQKPKAKE